MLDELRRLDWFSRGLRQRVRQIDEAMWQLEQDLGRIPTIQEIQNRTGLNKKKFIKGWKLYKVNLQFH